MKKPIKKHLKFRIGEKDELIVNGHKIKCIQASREGPKALPWKELWAMEVMHEVMDVCFFWHDE